MVSFIFGGDTNETPESIKRKRDVVRALLGAQGAPRNIGEGLNALGDGIVANVLDRRADKAEKAGLDSANSAFSSLFSGGGASGTPSPAPMTGTASEIKPDGNGSYRDAIASIESDGSGGYSAVGPTHPTMGRALGRYQVMESNIGPWSKEALGREITADEFLAHPELQDAIFDKKFGSYVSQYGPQGAAQAWFAGPGGVGKLDRKDSLGTSVADYTNKFSRNLGTEVASAQPTTASDAIAAQAPQIPQVQGGNIAAPVATASRGPVQALTAPQAAAPQLPPPSTVAPPPSVASAPQVAQAAPQQTPAQALSTGGPSMQQLIQASQNPFLSEGQRGVVGALLKQKIDQQEADRQLILKQRDPAYQLGLEKDRLEVENLRNPKIPPADQARIDIDKERLGVEKGKPIEVGGRLIGQDGKVIYEAPKDAVKVGAKETLVDPVSGKVIYQPTAATAQPDFTDVSSLRKEVTQLPSYKNLSSALPIYRSMAETAGRDTKASDLNLVYGLGKIMDPTSVVREGEMVMVKNTASLPDWLQGAIASLNGGAALTPETRQAIMTEAYGRVKGYDSAFQNDAGSYTDIAKRNNFNVADVIPNFGTYEPWNSAPAAKAQSIGADWQDLGSGVRIRKVN